VQLQQLADEYKIPLIEDAAHSFRSKIYGATNWGLSDYTIFSFQAIKIINNW